MPTDINIVKVNINDIVPSEFQPRKLFDEESIKELALSIKNYGILNPLLVRKKENKYEIIAGERRYRAAKMLGLTEIPVIIKELTDKEVLEVALADNIQRINLNPIEEAKSYKEVISLNNIKEDELSNKVGKTQFSISNKLRLLNLSEKVIDSILNGEISEKHGRLLLRLNEENQNNILNKIIEKRLSIKETEELINQKSSKNNILDVLNSIDIDNKDSNVFKDVEKEIIEKGEDNMNNNIGMGNFFPQINNQNQAPEKNTIMFNNNPMDTNITPGEPINMQNNLNTIPLSTLSQEPAISTINTTMAPDVNVTPEIVPTPPVIESPTIPNVNIEAPITVDAMPTPSPTVEPSIGININTQEVPTPEPVAPIVETSIPDINVQPMPEPPLFNANLSSAPIEPTVNVSINSPIEPLASESKSVDKIKEMLANLNDPKVSFKEYSNQEEKCIIISIKE